MSYPRARVESDRDSGIDAVPGVEVTTSGLRGGASVSRPPLSTAEMVIYSLPSKSDPVELTPTEEALPTADPDEWGRDGGDDKQERPGQKVKPIPVEPETVNPRTEMPVADSTFVVHGNWCGPGWTGGRKVTATDYRIHGGDWNAPAVDALDEACREHDKRCASGPASDGCSSKDDAKLAKDAVLAMRDPSVPNSKAMIVAGGMAGMAAAGRDDSPIVPLPFSNPTPGLPGTSFPGDSERAENKDKLDGRFLKRTFKVADEMLENAPKAKKLLGAGAKWIPIVGSGFDAYDVYEDAQEHGIWSKETGAAALDFAVNIFPPTGFVNDVYSVVTGDDGIFQGWFGDPS